MIQHIKLNTEQTTDNYHYYKLVSQHKTIDVTTLQQSNHR